MTSSVSRPRLQREWVLCAIAAAASRFVPVPVVDDLVKTRATRTAVARTWAAHGRAPAPEAVGILADDATTFWGGVRRSAARAPLKVLLYPVRKVVRVVTAVRGVSTDLVGVVLLARSVDRCLAAGWFAGTDEADLAAQARLVRRAHEQVVSRADLHVLTQAVSAALHGVGGLPQQALAFARRAFGSGDAPAEPLTTAGEQQVEAGAREVQAVFDRPDVADVLADLDRRFDAALATLGTGQTVPPAPGRRTS